MSLNFLGKNSPQFMVERKLRINSIVFFTVTVSGFDKSDATQIFQFTTNRVNLFTQQSRQFADKIFLFRVQQKRREKLHSRLRTEQRFEHRRRHVHKLYS